MVNGFISEQKELSQAGLLQRSLLFSILFLFFNANLIQQKINKKRGAIAFVDNYTAWVINNSATENQVQIQIIIKRVLKWEERSGATFEPDKTAYIHFTRNSKRQDNTPLNIRGNEIYPKDEVKILGVIMNCKLRYKHQMAKAATKGLAAACHTELWQDQSQAWS